MTYENHITVTLTKVNNCEYYTFSGPSPDREMYCTKLYSPEHGVTSAVRRTAIKEMRCTTLNCAE